MTVTTDHRPLTAGDACQDKVLLDDWHVIGFSTDFPPGEIHKVTLLERDLIVWRSSDGEAHVWEDLCIHRGARLSKGWLVGDNVVCPYHGWRYDQQGTCTLMPAAPTEKPMKKARAFPYPVQEVYGFVWVCLGEPSSDVPTYSQWDDDSFMKVHSGPYPTPATDSAPSRISSTPPTSRSCMPDSTVFRTIPTRSTPTPWRSSTTAR